MSKFSLIVTGLLVSGVFCTLPASAQSVVGSSDARDPFSRAASGDNGGLMQLLHTVQNGRLTSSEEFNRQQQQRIAGSTQDFRAEQLRRIREQQQQKKP
jgi:hypothetical protein